MNFGIWPSQRIRKAIEAGVISAGSPISEESIQPASLDLRLGDRAYRVPTSFLPGKGNSVAQRLSDLATHEVDLTRPQVLERNCVHIIPLQESLRLEPGTSARANPKSSSGRLDIFVRLIADSGTAFDEIPAGYRGPLFAEVVPRSFPVIARAGDTLNQLRFREVVSETPHQPSRTFPVSIDLEGAAADGIIAYRARKTTGLIDLRQVGKYDRNDFWEPIRCRPGRRELVLVPDEFYIMASLEDIEIGEDEAAEMIAYDTAVGEVRVHYAGFLDPFFGKAKAGSGNKSKVVLEIRSHDVPFMLDHGQRVGTLIFEDMIETPDKLYGQQIKSNYQGQGLKLAKQFF
ncbi:2'-deoxycytidine 5'-triphosphate deaminase [Bosea thiooxidans]|nr:2'-deoxycytidine 5'-triphosphate deaminase [Bosea sp. (in: a-proteobacteria)]